MLHALVLMGSWYDIVRSEHSLWAKSQKASRNCIPFHPRKTKVSGFRKIENVVLVMSLLVSSHKVSKHADFLRFSMVILRVGYLRKVMRISLFWWCLHVGVKSAMDEHFDNRSGQSRLVQVI